MINDACIGEKKLYESCVSIFQVINKTSIIFQLNHFFASSLEKLTNTTETNEFPLLKRKGKVPGHETKI